MQLQQASEKIHCTVRAASGRITEPVTNQYTAHAGKACPVADPKIQLAKLPVFGPPTD